MAASKKNDLKAKQKRQKIMAIGGAVLLLGLLAFQVPRTMKMLNASAPPPPPAPAAPGSVPTDPSVLPTPGTAGGAGGGAAGGVSGTLVESDPTPAAKAGQLVAFGKFSSKDPFHQQIDEDNPPAVGGAVPPPADGEAPAGDDGGVVTPTPGTGAGSGGGTSTPTPSGPSVPAGSAIIAVNGAEETVARGASFPKDAPMFTLVSVGSGQVKIAVAGGAFASGARTLALAKGKPVTLVNTADGTRFELKLVAAGA